MATYTFDNLGRTAAITYGNGIVEGLGFDPVSRLSSLDSDLPGRANDKSATFTYDARGNLTGSGSSAYTYTSENFLKSGPNAAALTYDPLGRLYQTNKGSAATVRITIKCIL